MPAAPDSRLPAGGLATRIEVHDLVSLHHDFTRLWLSACIGRTGAWTGDEPARLLEDEGVPEASPPRPRSGSTPMDEALRRIKDRVCCRGVCCAPGVLLPCEALRLPRRPLVVSLLRLLRRERERRADEPGVRVAAVWRAKITVGRRASTGAR